MIMQIIRCDFCGREVCRDLSQCVREDANLLDSELKWFTVSSAASDESYRKREEHLCPNCYKRIKCSEAIGELKAAWEGGKE